MEGKAATKKQKFTNLKKPLRISAVSNSSNNITGAETILVIFQMTNTFIEIH